MIRVVTKESALDWAAGKIRDDGLVPGTKAIYIAALPDRLSYCAVTRQLIRAFRGGAFFLFTRSDQPVVMKHMEDLGAITTVIEQHPRGNQRRYVLPPEAWRAWVRKMRVKTADA